MLHGRSERRRGHKPSRAKDSSIQSAPFAAPLTLTPDVVQPLSVATRTFPLGA